MKLNGMHLLSKKIITLLGICLVTILSSCSTVQKDGPPPYDIDVSRIPDAKPKVEPLSKTGNKTYEVFGKRYYVMSNSKNYQEKGVASWYGTKFHKRFTSSGERYNMLAMTAAHKTLPLPTYVQVKNLKNGKTVIVKVNDRGPFESNRLIDLSYAAAKKLEIVGHGTARVEVTAINPREYRRTPSGAPIFVAKNNKHTWTPPSSRSSSVYLQVGAFRNKAYAEKLKNQIQARIHFPVYITEIHSSIKLYRVQIGPIKNQVAASKISKQLSSLGLNGKVMFA